MLPIYCDHFNLRREPFNITPDPGFLYLSESHKEALAQLVYGIKGRRGFVVLTGEVGTGKTTLVHCLLNELNGNSKTAMVFNMVEGAKDLLRYVCEKFGILPPKDAHGEIHDYLCALEQFLVESYRNGQNAALIIDEAQNLSTEVLENVRLLSNFETANDKLLQILLVGQPELGVRLNALELRQLKQRVALRHHLRPLNLTECKDYISRRLEVAGGSIGLFPPETVEAIHDYSGGIPRLINILSDNGLLTAYALRRPAVGRSMIAEVARDLQLTVTPRLVRKPLESKMESGAGLDRSIPSSRLVSLGVKKPEHVESESQPRRYTVSHSLTDNKVAGAGVRPNNSVHAHDQTDTSKLSSSRLSSRCIDYLIAVLTEAMGPMASVIIREQVRSMGESVDEFPRRRVGELIEELTGEIATDAGKAKCKYAMLEGIRRLEADHA
jgi:type II secretory pathway predicted ATPase ExeA